MGPRHRWGDLLVGAGVISEDQLYIALEKQRQAPNPKPRLGAVILEAGFASENAIAKALSTQLQIPYVDLSTVAFDSELMKYVPRWLAERHNLVPIEYDETEGLLIVIADPTNVVAVDDVRVSARVPKLRVGIAPVTMIQEARDRLYAVDTAASEVLKRLGVATEVEVLPEHSSEAEEADLTAERDDAVMAPIIRLTNALLADAVRARATDVHIEPAATEVEVRYRVDGLLREVMTLPKHIQGLVVSRLKIMAGMDIAERRRPQDGRSRILVDRQEVDTRVSTIPTLGGEKVVIRLLYKNEAALDLEVLGMEPEQKSSVEHHLANPQGLIVFTGPTGSGKTSTMYASLKAIQSSEKNMVTLEDPIEYELPFLNQVQIDDKTGVTFARGLRHTLRQDPDVIMVGEIRDGETAQIVMQSALTGHLVLSSLHTNDAPSAITRLIDLGIEPFLIASAVSMVIAQRLVRVICENCKEEADISEKTLSLLGLTRNDLQGASFMKGAGCESCGYTGYRGRTGLFEVLPITSQLRDQISSHVSDTALAYAVRSTGVIGLREAGLRKAEAGITTMEEVLRVTYTEHEEIPRCPSCRQEVEPSFVVCPYCQSDLGEQACPDCGKEVQADWKVCPHCRSDLPALFGATHKQRILVIDDADDLRLIARTKFQDAYDVLEAATGEDGIRLATLMRPDLILVDLRLPDIDGTEVAKRLRRTAATSLIPLIMLTGEADEASELESLRAGVDDYITKPFDWSRLEARMDSVMRRATRPVSRSAFDLERTIELDENVPEVSPSTPSPSQIDRKINIADELAALEPEVPAVDPPKEETEAPKPVAKKPTSKAPAKPNLKAEPSAPSNGVATISFNMSEAAKVTLTIHNEKGTLVRTLMAEKKLAAGSHAVRWDGTNNAHKHARPGTYTYEIGAVGAESGGSAVLKGKTKIGVH